MAAMAADAVGTPWAFLASLGLARNRARLGVRMTKEDRDLRAV
jgi:hypothetical protein